MKIAIIDESPADIPAIEILITEAFLEAPHSNQREQWIVRTLRDNGELSLSLVAKDGEILVGYVAVSAVTIADQVKDWYGLGPIAVLPAYQGRGIGGQLMREALLRIREHGAAGCVVLGEPDYYKRFGFRSDTQLQLAGAPHEFFMALAFGGKIPQGEVSYPEAFNAVEP